MKTSTEIGSFSRIIGEESAVELVAKAGFDAFDFSMFEMCRWDKVNNRPKDSTHPLSSSNYLAFAKRLRQIGLDSGIVCNQSHAPFPSRLVGMDNLRRAIECTAEAGGQICVIHPDNNGTAEQNAEMYHELLPFAKQHGVKIATENMWNWDKEHGIALPAACSSVQSFTEHIKTVNDSDFIACLDIGHAEMMGETVSAEQMIFALRDKLGALHIHDNDKIHDSHQIPGSMKIDFKPIAAALKSIGYNGYYTLEADRYFDNYAPEDILSGLKRLRQSLEIFK